MGSLRDDEGGDTCLESLRHSASTKVFRGNILSETGISRTVWWKGQTGPLRKLSGFQTNGLSHNATGRSESPLLLFPLQTRKTVTLIIPLTSPLHVLPLFLSPEHISNLSRASTQICGTQQKKRWRLTDRMALERSSNYLLGSMQLAPDGSRKSSTMLMALWSTTRTGWLAKGYTQCLALTLRRLLFLLFAIPPSASS
jgi:hypothetical protein